MGIGMGMDRQAAGSIWLMGRCVCVRNDGLVVNSGLRRLAVGRLIGSAVRPRAGVRFSIP